jgi:hypothetical protein
MPALERTSDKRTRYWRRVRFVGLGTWRADGNREDTGIVLLRRERSTNLMSPVSVFLDARLKNTGKRLNSVPFGQDELKIHLPTASMVIGSFTTAVNYSSTVQTERI